MSKGILGLPPLPEAEMALSIDFVETVRTGPEVGDRKTRLRLEDPGFRGGTITVYLTQRLAIIVNPKRDDKTGEPVTSRVPFDNVVGWEALSEKMRFHFYATESERQAVREADERRAREIAAAEAAARARVLEAEAATGAAPQVLPSPAAAAPPGAARRPVMA